VGSVREVAACLEQVIGADLSQQRDAVRAWLARSEPSGSGPPRSSKPMLDSIVTRVDGGSKSEPSSNRQGGNRLSRPGEERVSRPPVDRGAVTSPAPADEPRGPREAGVNEQSERSAHADKVSSVSSVVRLPLDGSGAGPVSTASPSQSRAAKVAIALVAAVVLLGAGAWGARSFGTAPGPTSGAAVDPSARALPDKPLSPESSGAGAGAGAGAAAPTASTATTSAALLPDAPSATASATAKPGAVAKPPGAPKPPPKPPASVKPPTTDDLRNPYR
jgi:hypothetical protein